MWPKRDQVLGSSFTVSMETPTQFDVAKSNSPQLVIPMSLYRITCYTRLSERDQTGEALTDFGDEFFWHCWQKKVHGAFQRKGDWGLIILEGESGQVLEVMDLLARRLVDQNDLRMLSVGPAEHHYIAQQGFAVYEEYELCGDILETWQAVEYYLVHQATSSELGAWSLRLFWLLGQVQEEEAEDRINRLNVQDLQVAPAVPRLMVRPDVSRCQLLFPEAGR